MKQLNLLVIWLTFVYCNCNDTILTEDNKDVLTTFIEDTEPLQDDKVLAAFIDDIEAPNSKQIQYEV